MCWVSVLTDIGADSYFICWSLSSFEFGKKKKTNPKTINETEKARWQPFVEPLA